MAQGYGQHQSQEPVLWDRVEWRQGDGRYTFQVASGGLLATLSSPHGSALTIRIESLRRAELRFGSDCVAGP